MIREFIRECLMFRTKDRIVIWIGIAVWTVVCLNVMFWTGVINL